MKFEIPKINLEKIESVDFVAASQDSQPGNGNTAYYDPNDGSWWSPRY